MVLYVMRHAEAVRVGGSILRDADRPLSPQGEQDAELMARAVNRMDPPVDLVLTSPLLRATQTGEFFRKAIGDRAVVRTSENLLPGFRPKTFLEELSGAGLHTAIVCIGHEPDLSRLIATLIAESGRAVVAMTSSAVARIRFSSDDVWGEASLQGLLSPEILRKLQS